jgi:formylglycine-generating enzyme required for sulfatase activity
MAKVALLIGVSEYETGLDGLPSAVNDVTAMRQVLANPEMGEFVDAAVNVLQNPSRQVMEDAIYHLFANRQKDDLVLLYFSGHGVVDDGGEFYFASRFTRKDQGRLVPTTAVAARSVRDWMEQSKSQCKVIILDSCFSGAFAKGVKAKDSGSVNPERFLGGKGTAILTASTSTQYALTQEGFDLSVYTHYLVEGIRTGGADRDDDGFISVEELHDYANSKVKEAAPAMTPEFYPVKEGYKILLAKSPKDDPMLKYRKQVGQRVYQGTFSIPARRLLNSLRLQLKLLPEVAEAIEAEVLQPYREYQRKLQEYEQTLVDALQAENPLSQRTLTDLKDYQQHLALLDEDVIPIATKLLGESLKIDVEEPPPILPPPSLTKSFEFEVVTVNPQGQEQSRERKRAEYFADDLGNGMTLDMVAIPGGRFQMGSNEYDREKPIHPVTIEPFFMGKYPVTQAQYEAIVGTNPSEFKGVQRPVEQVFWKEAVEFCTQLSQKTGKPYRLPSEAEWEYACRAGTTTPFYCGDTITTDLANYDGNYTHGEAPKGIYRKQTTDVGSFPANPFGLYDMHGNVWEWCADHWHGNYEAAPSDGSSWTTNKNSENRVLRGGSWNFNPSSCRAAYRFSFSPAFRFSYVGFRVVCSVFPGLF